MFGESARLLVLGACGRRGPQACVREARALQLNARSVRGTGEIMGRPPADVMVLVGSGAVENAWSPIYRALREFGCDAQSPTRQTQSSRISSKIVDISARRRRTCGIETTRRSLHRNPQSRNSIASIPKSAPLSVGRSSYPTTIKNSIFVQNFEMSETRWSATQPVSAS